MKPKFTQRRKGAKAIKSSLAQSVGFPALRLRIFA
jgi:hypothetical protein